MREEAIGWERDLRGAPGFGGPREEAGTGKLIDRFVHGGSSTMADGVYRFDQVLESFIFRRIAASDASAALRLAGTFGVNFGCNNKDLACVQKLAVRAALRQSFDQSL
ncbi:MAG: hypothetical protein FRX49_07191 [Trebouxia sp. A1-2]|nr:MAG: hypothetical protein FRX49_07191 [Trebouxia sp. A1-2]